MAMWGKAALWSICFGIGFTAVASACDISPETELPETVRYHDGLGVQAAWFDGPTDRYVHPILGDVPPAGSLHVLVNGDVDCQILTVVLDDLHVFEDIAPRLRDLDGDGNAEIIAVRTHINYGAQLIIYEVREYGGTLAMAARTPYIGKPHRWLAPIGVSDMDGDGFVEVAYIDRPHLARVLRIWRYLHTPGGEAALIPVGAVEGLTNHRIGEPYISGGIRYCGSGPEIVTADADWSHVMLTRWDGHELTTTQTAENVGTALQDVLGCRR